MENYIYNLVQDLETILACLPTTTPIGLLFDCIDSNSTSDDRMEMPLWLKGYEHIYFSVKHSGEAATEMISLFDMLPEELMKSNGLSLVFKLCNDRLSKVVSHGQCFDSTQLFDRINLLSTQMGTAGCGCGKCSIHSAVHGDCPNPDPECRIPALQAPYNSRSLHNLLEHVCCQCEVRNFTDLTNMVQLLLKTEYCAKLSEIADNAELRFHICSYYPVFKDYLEMESKGTKKSLIDCFYDYVIHNYLWISDKHIERLRKLAVTLLSLIHI